MATANRSADHDDRDVLKPKPRRDVDREALRAEINKRFENTLRYLAR